MLNSLNISDIVHYKSIENDVNTFDFNHGHELTNIGVQPDTIQTFKEIIASSIERTIPIFKYYDSHYNLNGYSYYSETFKKHIRLSKKPSFFYLEPPTRHAIKTVVICPDPIQKLY